MQGYRVHPSRLQKAKLVYNPFIPILLSVVIYPDPPTLMKLGMAAVRFCHNDAGYIYSQ